MRRKKKSAGKIVKTVPLSVAIALLSSGGLFASAADRTEDIDYIRVKISDSNYVEFDARQIESNNSYKANAQSILKQAFLDENNSIVIEYDDGTHVEFGKNASGTIGLDYILENPADYLVPNSPSYPY